ncbi:hypothetical protein CQZ98_24625 [Pseudomonas sp. MYb115]|nr:hypothetical protein CQZ98_24625 [Pseudomonas sp. MYb115]
MGVVVGPGVESCLRHQIPVGANLSNRRTVAMDVNDNACCLYARGGLRFIASRLAPTKWCC